MADKTFDVICICGSLRKGSYNRMVMNALPGLAPAGMRIKEAPPFSEFPLYNADLQDSAASLRRRKSSPTQFAPPTASSSTPRNTTFQFPAA